MARLQISLFFFGAFVLPVVAADLNTDIFDFTKPMIESHLEIGRLRVELEKAKHHSERDQILYTMQAKLWNHSPNRATSEQEYREAKANAEISKTTLSDLAAKIKEAEASKAFFEARSKGVHNPDQMQQLALLHKAVWEARLESAKVERQIAETTLEQRKWIFDMNDRLLQSQSTSYYEWVLAKDKYDTAITMEVASKFYIDEVQKALDLASGLCGRADGERRNSLERGSKERSDR